MSDDLFSPHWYRISELHPRLRAHVSLQRQNLRGQPWYLLSDPSEGRHFRLNASAYRFVGLCDGRRTVQDIWGILSDTLGEAAPTQNEIISLLGRLADAGMLQTEVRPDVETMFEGQAKRSRQQTLAQLNPLFMRVHLLDPTQLLRRLSPWVTGLYSRWGLLVWLGLMLAAAITVPMNWPALAVEAGAVAQSPRMLVLIWLAYPFIKLVHELAHAFAVRRWGGEVSSMGITLMMLTPVPWVDAGAATTFPHRHQRFLVSAAGIMAELLLSALAFFVWWASQPGMLHDVMLVIMLIGGVSTLLFNGNPLLRYDGYYMLCDALGMPNLAPHSRAYWAYLGKRLLLGLPAEAPVMGKGERPWLLFYAPAALLYRILLSLLILVWVLEVSKLLFLIAALFMLWSLALKPLHAILRGIWHCQGSPRQRRRARWLGLGSMTAALLAITLLPMPHQTVAEGVVWLPEQTQVRAETDGFVVRTHAADGSQVSAGQLLLSLEDPQLIAERDQLQGQWEALRAKQFQLLQESVGDAKNLADEMASLDKRMQRNAERIEQLRIRAGVSGKLVLPRQQDLAGHFARRGDQLGYVLPADTLRVRAVVSQDDAELVRASVREAQVWLREAGQGMLATVLARDLAAASDTLPSIALGERGGGSVPVKADDPKGLTAAEPVFLLELEVPGQRVTRVGGRALVRLDLGREALFVQAWRRIRQVFLAPAHVS